MRIEAIDPIKATDDDGTVLYLLPGDIKSVGDNFGKLACSLGWARDMDGVVETGQKSTRRVTVTPQNIVVQSRHRKR